MAYGPRLRHKLFKRREATHHQSQGISPGLCCFRLPLQKGAGPMRHMFWRHVFPSISGSGHHLGSPTCRGSQRRRFGDRVCNRAPAQLRFQHGTASDAVPDQLQASSEESSRAAAGLQQGGCKPAADPAAPSAAGLEHVGDPLQLQLPPLHFTEGQRTNQGLFSNHGNFLNRFPTLDPWEYSVS